MCSYINMRIITGTAKGSKLKTLDGISTRPTSERVKEAIFSMIQFDIEGRQILDLFAGSGQLGLEAISRGAAGAMFVDSSAAAIAIIKENAQKTHLFDRCRFLISDYRSYLRKAGVRERRTIETNADKASPSGIFDIVFIDPPYASGLLCDALARLYESKLLKPYATIICEFEQDKSSAFKSEFENYETIKKASYGRTKILVLKAASTL